MLKDLCFEIIQTCPNKCKFCSSNSSEEKNTIIELEKFKETVNYFINKSGIEEISISGGEPFLHPNLFEMISYCKSKGIRTVLFTSGINRGRQISRKEIEELEEECNNNLEKIEKFEPWNDRLKTNVKNYFENFKKEKKYGSITKNDLIKLNNIGLDKIVFDFQALEEEIDNDLMGRNKLNRLLCESLVKASQTDIDVGIHFIPMKPNFKQFNNIIEISEMLNIKDISILNFVPQGRGKEFKHELVLSDKELNEFSEILQKEAKNFSGNIRIGIPLNGKISHMCNAGIEKLDIKYDGTILPCPAFKELSHEKMQKYGVKIYSIYENLKNFELRSNNFNEPLCKQIYGFNKNLINQDEENFMER
ncbi:MAG TPA: radical SAM protein [Clostridia bacterium]|nr:radical SAM protein [Clostridia bacterium]